MEVIVFSSPGCKLMQKNKLISEEHDLDYDFRYVCHKFIINDNDEFEIRETCNSFLLRLLCNSISFFFLGSRSISEQFRDIQYKAYKKNKKIASFIFMPLIKMRGKIIIKPLKCNEDTLICIYLLKTKIPFMVDSFDGDVEVVLNKRGKLK